MMLKVQYTLSRSKDRQESLVATLEKDLKLHNQLFSEETIVECEFNTELTLSSNTVVEMLISAFLFGPLIPYHHIHRDTVLTKVIEIYLHVFSHAAVHGGIADQMEWRVTLQECFPLTKWDAHESDRLCSYWKTKGCL